MKLTKYSQLKHGMRVKCVIEGTKIDDAKLSIDRYGRAYICQNTKDGMPCEHKLGYKYACFLSYRDDNIEEWNTDVENLEAVDDQKHEGDKITYTYDQTLEACNRLSRAVKFGVDSNPEGKGGYNEIYFDVDAFNTLSSYKYHTCHNPNQNGIDYEFATMWKTEYEGNFYPLPVSQGGCLEDSNAFELIDSNFVDVTKSEGFNPETLEFNGVKIKAGDGVKLYDNSIFTVEGAGKDDAELILDIGEGMPICNLNITAHYPAEPKKSELEEAEEQLDALFIDKSMLTSHTQKEWLDRYYEARKRVEELKPKE